LQAKTVVSFQGHKAVRQHMQFQIRINAANAGALLMPVVRSVHGAVAHSRLLRSHLSGNSSRQNSVAMPSRSVSDGGRSFQYIPQIEPNKQLNRKIEDSVLAAFEEWKQSQSESEVR